MIIIIISVSANIRSVYNFYWPFAQQLNEIIIYPSQTYVLIGQEHVTLRAMNLNNSRAGNKGTWSKRERGINPRDQVKLYGKQIKIQ